MHGQNFGGRDLVVNEARPHGTTSSRSGGFGGGNGGGGYGGGGRSGGGGYGGGGGSYGGGRGGYCTRMQGRRCLPSRNQMSLRAPFLLSETLPPLAFPGSFLAFF